VIAGSRLFYSPLFTADSNPSPLLNIVSLVRSKRETREMPSRSCLPCPGRHPGALPALLLEIQLDKFLRRSCSATFFEQRSPQLASSLLHFRLQLIHSQVSSANDLRSALCVSGSFSFRLKRSSPFSIPLCLGRSSRISA